MTSASAGYDALRNPQPESMPANIPHPHDPVGCVPVRQAQAVVIGWSVWTGATAFLVGRWGLDSFAKWVGVVWAFTFTYLVMELLDA